LPKSEKRSPSGKNPGGDECTSSSLRSENSEMKSAVEMTPPWKAWKTQKKQSEFSTLSTGLGNPAKNKSVGFPHFHRAGGEAYLTLKGQNMKAKLNSS